MQAMAQAIISLYVRTFCSIGNLRFNIMLSDFNDSASHNQQPLLEPGIGC
jgi:hypothetical protein